MLQTDASKENEMFPAP